MNEFIATLGRWISQFSLLAIIMPWEQGIRVRRGKDVRILPPGIHARVPVLDSVYRQSIRQRSSLVATQTLTTKDGVTLTVCVTLGYRIVDIFKAYNSLQHAEDTLCNMTAVALARYIYGKNKLDLNPNTLAADLTEELTQTFIQYGLAGVDVRVTDFAYIRAIRIMQDYRYQNHSDSFNTIKDSTA